SRPQERPHVKTVMFVKPRVLDGDDGIQQMPGHLVQSDRDAVFPVERGDAPAVNVVHVAGELLLEDDLVQRRRAAQVACDHAGRAAEQDGYDKNDDDDGEPTKGSAGQRGLPPGCELMDFFIIAWLPGRNTSSR